MAQSLKLLPGSTSVCWKSHALTFQLEQQFCLSNSKSLGDREVYGHIFIHFTTCRKEIIFLSNVSKLDFSRNEGEVHPCMYACGSICASGPMVANRASGCLSLDVGRVGLIH